MTTKHIALVNYNFSESNWKYIEEPSIIKGKDEDDLYNKLFKLLTNLNSNGIGDNFRNLDEEESREFKRDLAKFKKLKLKPKNKFKKVIAYYQDIGLFSNDEFYVGMQINIIDSEHKHNYIELGG